jgi:NTP pyrophosphatase (non-canonical NTP hydrolase)
MNATKVRAFKAGLTAYLEASSPREAAPGAVGVTLDALRKANIERQAIWCPDEVPDLSFRGNELAGEVGEASNVIKKLERERHGWRGSRDTKEHLAEELADVVICADLCALTAGVDLAAAVVAKFNATSDKVGIPVKLTVLPSGQNETGGEIVLPIQMQERYYGSEIQAMLDELNAGRSPASGERNAVVEADERAELEEYRRRANLNPLSGMSWNGFNIWGDDKSMTEVKAAVHSHSQIYGFRTLIRHQREEIGKLHSQIRALKETPNA